MLFPALISAAEIVVLKTELQRWCELRSAEIVRERSGMPRMVFRRHDADSPTACAAFYALSRLPRILRPAQQVLCMFITASATSKRLSTALLTHRHQGYGYWMCGGIAQANMATMMVMLEGATEMGGCL